MSNVPENVKNITYHVAGFSRLTNTWATLGSSSWFPDSPSLLAELGFWKEHHNPMVWDSEFKIVKRTETVTYEEVDEHAKALGT